MIERILAAVDGSDTAMKAVDWAAVLAAKHGAALDLVAVVSDPVSADPGLSDYARAEHIREPAAALANAAADNILRRARERASAAGARTISVVAEVGDPATRLVEAARVSKADMIVVGHRGHGRLAGLLIGSVAQKLVSHAPCPVLVVR